MESLQGVITMRILFEAAKYFMVIFMAFYTVASFLAFKQRRDADGEIIPRRGIYVVQNVLMFLMHFLGFLSIYMVQQEWHYWILYLAQAAVLIFYLVLWGILYPA